MLYVLQKIPDAFRKTHMKVLHGEHVFLSLHGLPPSACYTVHLSVAPNQDLWMDEGWSTFVNKIRNGENRIMLIFRYVGRMKFVVWRFTSDGSMMLRNPEPPSEDIVLHTRLKVKYPSFVTDPWDISSSICSPVNLHFILFLARTHMTHQGLFFNKLTAQPC